VIFFSFKGTTHLSAHRPGLFVSTFAHVYVYDGIRVSSV
jgi:hypothetical protein